MRASHVIQIFDLRDVDKAAQELLHLCENRFFFGFYGSLGAGKTTFIKALCKALGSADAASSPTFSIVNEYHTRPNASGKIFTIYHMDFYRVKNTDEALQLGAQEYFSATDAYCFVEWPQVVEPLLPDSLVKVHIESSKYDERTVTIEMNSKN